MPDYRTVDIEHPTLFEGSYRQAKAAKLKTAPYKHSRLKYRDWDAGVNYTYKLNPEHYLTLGLGNYHQTLDWNENPRFLGKEYDYVVGSLGFTSLAIENWRWSGASVLAFQTENFGIKESGWISAMFWGEYSITKRAHFHVGFWGYTGVKNVYFLPILGIDWKAPKGEISAIFPFDIALRYKPTKNFHFEAAGKWFGGPYRFPQRVHKGIDGFEEGIFELFTPTTEIGVYYHPSAHLNIGISGGYSWGGWLLIRNKHNAHGKYYNLESTPYGALSGLFKF